MALSEKEISSIESSWKLVEDQGLTDYGVNMMVNIYTMHPHMKPLWKFAKNLNTEDEIRQNKLVRSHGEKLFTTIGKAVSSLRDLSALVPVLIGLGAKHYKYGTLEEHFTPIGQSLIKTLQNGLKDEFTEEVMNSWIRVYQIVTEQMSIGIQQARANS